MPGPCFRRTVLTLSSLSRYFPFPPIDPARSWRPSSLHFNGKSESFFRKWSGRTRGRQPILGPLKTQALVFENSKKEIKIIIFLQKLIHCGLINVLIIYLTAKASINKKILRSQRRATLNIYILQLGHKIVLHTAQKLGID